MATAATQMGVIVGTAAYMSPEQARGRPVDRRADGWAFGAVVYEMLTGRKAFEGDDVTGILAEGRGPIRPSDGQDAAAIEGSLASGAETESTMP